MYIFTIILTISLLFSGGCADSSDKALEIVKYICKDDFYNFYINSSYGRYQLAEIERNSPKILWDERKREAFERAKRLSETDDYFARIKYPFTNYYYEIRQAIGKDGCDNIKIVSHERVVPDLVWNTIVYNDIETAGGLIVRIFTSDGLFVEGHIVPLEIYVIGSAEGRGASRMGNFGATYSGREIEVVYSYNPNPGNPIAVKVYKGNKQIDDWDSYLQQIGDQKSVIAGKRIRLLGKWQDQKTFEAFTIYLPPDIRN